MSSTMGCPTQKHIMLTLSPILMTTLNYGQVFCFEENNSLKLGKNLMKTLWKTPGQQRRLINKCDFQTEISKTLLRNIFVCGVYSDILGEKLLSEDAASLTFEEAITRGELWEHTHSERWTVDINHVNASHTTTIDTRPAASNKACYRCGNLVHLASSAACPAHSATCHFWSKVGHYRLMGLSEAHERPPPWHR